MLVTLRVLVAALGLATKVLAQEQACYAPNGDIADNSTYIPCNKLGINQVGYFSSCCALDGDVEEQDVCSSSALCINRQGKPMRGFCTDMTWKSNACVPVCMDEESGGSSSNSSFLTPCNDGTATYCCGDSNTTCCGTDKAFSISVYGSIDPSPSQTPAAAAEPDGLSGGAIAGVVIGCLAGLALIGAAFYFWRRRRHRNKTKGADAPDEPGMGGKQELDATSAPYKREEIQEMDTEANYQELDAPMAYCEMEQPERQLEPVELPAESFAEPRADPPPSEVGLTPEGSVRRKSSQVVQGK
ncbi:hypothetical protein CMUS01_05476 [Colletotrichum musicola]|uniref:Uncharacterized protein n=1 Tax=Colletotrichum musicola TaxID=2175873 RepID=A0A8H6KR83_9PEZI|nr:hypothetical protein CMUS01_05476 [Colletotrichum musicola]